MTDYPQPLADSGGIPQPIFCLKQTLPAEDERRGLITLNHRLPIGIRLETYYTRLDQALLLWGGVAAVIFLLGQFSQIDWRTQAAVDSVLTLAAVAATVVLTWRWATVKGARWAIGLWSTLMIGAIGFNDYGIWVGNGLILRHLCTGWLGICALGYLATAIGMRSRALGCVGLLHLGTVPLLGVASAWQFLLTGSVLAVSLWVLGTLQWDHS